MVLTMELSRAARKVTEHLGTSKVHFAVHRCFQALAIAWASSVFGTMNKEAQTPHCCLPSPMARALALVQTSIFVIFFQAATLMRFIMAFICFMGPTS